MTTPIYDYDDAWINVYKDGYLKKITLNIWNGKGIQVDEPYFHDFHKFDAFGPYKNEVDFDCTTMLTKNTDL